MALTFAGQHPVNNILTQMAAEGLDQPFLCDQGVLPQINVPEVSGTWLSDDPRGYTGAVNINIERASGAPRSTGQVNDPLNGTFQCEDYAHQLPIDLRIDTITDQLGNLPVRRAAQAANVVKLKAERRLAALLFDGGTFFNSTTAANIVGGGGIIWSGANSTPVTDLALLCQSTQPLNGFGQRVNTMVISRDVAVELNAHPEVRGYADVGGFALGVGSRVLGSNDNFLRLRAILADICDLDVNRIFIGSFVRNTANTNQAGVPAFLWTNSVWLGTVDLGAPKSVTSSNRVLMAPTAAIDFSAYAFEAGSYQSEDMLTQHMFAQQANAYTGTNGALGYHISNCLT